MKSCDCCPVNYTKRQNENKILKDQALVALVAKNKMIATS